MQKRSTV